MPRLFCCSLLFLTFFFPVYAKAGESLSLNEQLICPVELPEAVVWEALQARIFLHGIIASSEKLTQESELNRHFPAEDRIFLAAVLWPMHILRDEEAAKDTLKARLFAERIPFDKDLSRFLVRSQTILPLFRHLLTRTERTLKAMNAHWPRVTLYAESLLPENKKQNEEVEPWNQEDWLYNANVLKALRLLYASLRLDDEEWFTSENALNNLEEAATLLPSDPYILTLLAEARLLHALPSQSCESATRALAVDDSMQRARYLRALANWQLQQFGLAENDLSVILEGKKDEDSAEVLSALRARGAVRMLLGRVAGMCEDFKRACALGDCDGLMHVRKQDHCR